MDFKNPHVDFVGKVNEVISSEADRDLLFEALKKYQVSSDVRQLIQDLKRIISDPSKLEIYDCIRPLIRPIHQQNYDKMAPSTPGKKLRLVKLKRRANESFGFAVRGGFEHGIGIYVSSVEPNSQASQRGLKVGDHIVRVNGFTIAEAIHDEVLNLIKGRDELELKVTSIGMVPIKQNATDPVTWQYVDKLGISQPEAILSYDEENTVKIFINLRGAPSLGCSIISGTRNCPGIYIETVRPGSLGAEYGLERGDQIIEVNGKSFLDIKKNEAIVELKGIKELNIVLKKLVGLAFLDQIKKNSGETSEKASAPKLGHDSDVLEADITSDADRRRVEEDQERLMKKQADEQQMREKFRQMEIQHQRDEEAKQKELEDRQKMEAEMQKQFIVQAELKKERDRIAKEAELKEEARKKEEASKKEEQRKKDEQRRKDEERQKEEQRKIEEERKKETERKKEEEKRQAALAKKQQSAVLAGRSIPQSGLKPTLLGAAPAVQSFGKSSKKVIRDVIIKKDEEMPLDIELEGGIGSPLGGRIVIADIFPGGAVDKDGVIKKSDQILRVNGKSFENIELTAAQEMLWQIEQSCPNGGDIKITIAESETRGADEILDDVMAVDINLAQLE